MIKPAVRVMGIILICFSLTGCWDATAIDQLAIVSMSGLDVAPSVTGTQNNPTSLDQSGTSNTTPPSALPRNPGATLPDNREEKNGVPVQLTLQIARVSQMGSGQSSSNGPATGTNNTFVVVRAVGTDTMDALEHARNEVPRRLYLAQRQVVVLGEKFARQDGAMAILDEVVRNPFSRLSTDVLVAYHTQATEILRRPYVLTRLPSNAVHGLEKENPVPRVDANEFLRDLTGKSDPYAVGIEPQQTRCAEEPVTFNLQHIALFQKNQLVGWLEGKQVEGFMWLTNRMKNRYISVTVPGHPGYVGTRLLRTQTHRQVVLNHGHPEVWLKVLAENDIAQNTTNLNLRHPADEALLLKSMGRDITDEMQSALAGLQRDTHSDATGFGELIYCHYPAVWQQMQPHWREEFAHLPVHIQVRVILHRAGLVGRNIYPIQ